MYCNAIVQPFFAGGKVVPFSRMCRTASLKYSLVTTIENPRVKHWIQLSENEKYRQNSSSTILVGTKLIRELGRRYRLKSIILTASSKGRIISPPDFYLSLRHDTIHFVSANLFKRLAKTESFQGGACAEILVPPPTKSLGDPRLILCIGSSVQDPAMLGTLLRTALALEWQAVWFLPGSLDPFSPLCIKASQGALFYLPYMYGTIDELNLLANRHSLALLNNPPHVLDHLIQQKQEKQAIQQYYQKDTTANITKDTTTATPPKGQETLLLRSYSSLLQRVKGVCLCVGMVTSRIGPSALLPNNPHHRKDDLSPSGQRYHNIWYSFKRQKKNKQGSHKDTTLHTGSDVEYPLLVDIPPHMGNHNDQLRQTNHHVVPLQVRAAIIMYEIRTVFFPEITRSLFLASPDKHYLKHPTT